MADFLSSFNFGAKAPAPSNNGQCTSVEDMQARLRGALDAKTTDTRAEHVSLTFELRNTTQFTISISDTDDDAIEGLEDIDPSLGGLASTTVASNPLTGHTSRLVRADDTLMNQSDNPLLQRTVAKHTLAAVSHTDTSNWALRDLSRSPQGWTFSYLCKDSYQHWRRQNSKNPPKAIIAEYTMRDPDPVLMSRPAFDCRGSITISFNRSTRSITLKYDHTLLHKTVAQLSENYPPPVRELGPGAQRMLEILQEKKPKKKSSSDNKKKRRGPKLDDDGNPIPKKTKRSRDPPELDDDGNLTPKKRKKQNIKKAQFVPDGPITRPHYPGAGSFDGYNHQDATTGGQDPQAFSDYSEGLVDGGGGGSQLKQPATAPSGLLFHVSLNEAARRLTIARKMLNDAGVDPNSLSTDQMNIFSNQSPDLQKDSVAMLAKYGAERLQIIHPANKEKPNSKSDSTSTSPMPTTHATPSGPMTTKELAPHTQNPGQKSGCKQKSTAKAAEGENPTAGLPPSKSKWTPGKLRVVCLSCKSRKVKCPKERPTCTECQEEAHQCEYPPQRPKQRKSVAVVTIDEEKEMGDDIQQDMRPEPRPEPQPEPHHDEAYHTGVRPVDSHDMSYSQMLVADMLIPNAPEAHSLQPSYFPSSSRLSIPHADPSHVSHQALSTASGLALPHGNMHHPPEPQTTSNSTMSMQADVSTTQADQLKKQNRVSGASGDTPQRSLPSHPASSSVTQDSSQYLNSAASSASWMVDNAAQSSTSISAVSPTLTHQAVRNSQRPRQPGQLIPTDSPQLRDNLAQPVVNDTQVTMRQAQPAQQSPSLVAAMHAQARTPPFHGTGHQRTNSRQGHRAQTRTPNADQSVARGYRSPAAHHQSMSDSIVSRTQANDLVASSMNYNNYGRNHGANSAANDHSSNRITYESYTQQQSTAPSASSLLAYDYSRTPATTMSMSNPAATAVSNSYNTTTPAGTNQWSGSQSRAPRTYDTTATFNTSSSRSQQTQSSTSNQASSATLHNFNMRGSTQLKRQTPPANSSMSKKPNNYSQYSLLSQQLTNDQQMNNNPAWYGFSGNNSGSFASSHNAWI